MARQGNIKETIVRFPRWGMPRVTIASTGKTWCRKVRLVVDFHSC